MAARAFDFSGGDALYKLDHALECRLKLANHYLPRTWLSVAMTVPALLIAPSYQSSPAFHLAMCLAWASWIACTYKLESAARRLQPELEVLPRRTWLISACLGSHPLNYFLVACTLALHTFGQTAISLMILPAVPLVIVMSASWYLIIFGNLRQFINERLPGDQAIPEFAEQGIALGLALPGALQLSCLALSHEPDWIMRSWIPIGILVAIACLSTFKNKLAMALALQDEALAQEAFDREVSEDEVLRDEALANEVLGNFSVKKATSAVIST